MISARISMVILLSLGSQNSNAYTDVSRHLSAPTFASSQDRGLLLSEQLIHMTLGDAVFLGLRNNRDIRSAYLQRIAQKFELRVAENAFNPRLVLKADIRHTKGSEDRAHKTTLSPTTNLLSEYGTRLSLGWTRQMNNAEHTGRLRSDGLDLTVIQPLWRGAGRDVTMAPLRLARVSEQANRLNLKASVSRTLHDIITTYRELLRAQEQLAIVQEALKRARLFLEVNKALISAGRMAEFEIIQTEADIATQELGVEDAKNQVAVNLQSLLRLLALDLSTQVHASEVPEPLRVIIDRQQAVRLAQSQQPQYLSALLGSEQSELNLIIAKDQSRWDVSLVAGANQVRGEGPGRLWDSFAGVQLEVPIGDLRSRQSEVHARINVEQQKIALEDARQELERSVNDVVRELGTRWRQYEIAQRATSLSKRKLEIEQEKLSVGRSSNFQILSFEADMRYAEHARLNALIAYLNAQTRLDVTLGTILDSWEIALNDF